MVVDTGANVSIIRKDLAQNSKLSIIWTLAWVSLQTVTDDKIQVHGKANVTLRTITLNFENSNMHSKFEDITLFGLQPQFEFNQKIIAKPKLSLSPRTEYIIPGLVAENRKFRFGLIDYPDPGNFKARSTYSPVGSRPFEFSHTKDLVKDFLQNTDLDEKQKCAAGRLIKEFQSPLLFSRTFEDFGRTRLTKHRIDTGEYPPINPLAVHPADFHGQLKCSKICSSRDFHGHVFFFLYRGAHPVFSKFNH
ncbi:retrovirus-related Pol polyprotein from transposon 412 [Trichonephila clavipes]|nr:retrovirus-related Pol polyprotein from transposon 412 [Trichonephila clavipes]